MKAGYKQISAGTCACEDCSDVTSVEACSAAVEGIEGVEGPAEKMAKSADPKVSM